MERDDIGMRFRGEQELFFWCRPGDVVAKNRPVAHGIKYDAKFMAASNGGDFLRRLSLEVMAQVPRLDWAGYGKRHAMVICASTRAKNGGLPDTALTSTHLDDSEVVVGESETVRHDIGLKPDTVQQAEGFEVE